MGRCRRARALDERTADQVRPPQLAAFFIRWQKKPAGGGPCLGRRLAARRSQHAEVPEHLRGAIVDQVDRQVGHMHERCGGERVGAHSELFSF
jgi:hypothetical protein